MDCVKYFALDGSVGRFTLSSQRIAQYLYNKSALTFRDLCGPLSCIA